MNRNATIKFSLYFSLLLTVGYISKWSVSYLNAFFYTDIQQIEYTTSAPVCSEGICSITYSLEKSAITKAAEGKLNPDLVVGIVWNAAKIKCDEKNLLSTGSSTNPITTKDIYSNFITVSAEAFASCNSPIRIAAYYPANQLKHGLRSGEIFLAPHASALSMEAFSDFVENDLKIFNLCAILAVLLFSIFIRIVTFDTESYTRVRMAALLAIGASAQSGMFEIWFPFSFMPTLNRWIAALAYCSYAAYGINYLGRLNSNTSRKIIITSATLFIITLLATQARVQTWIIFSVVASAAYFILFTLKRTPESGFASVFFTLTTLDFLGFKAMPNSYTAPTFLALIILAENQKAFLSYLKINRLLKLSRTRGSEQTNRKQTRYRTHALIKLFQRQFKIKKITVLNLTDCESIQLQQYTRAKSQPRTKSVTELSPVFAHVVTTGNSLINVHSESELIASLRRGDEKPASNSKHFTVLPIFSGNETIGAISLTDYDADQFKTSLNYSTFLFCLDILKGMLVEHLLTAPKTESLNKIGRLNSKIIADNLDSYTSVEQLIVAFGKILNSTFGWRIISATLPTADYLLKVGDVLSFDPEIEKQVRAGQIYAHEDNRQGPLALAVHNKRPVIVPNTKWLEGVVHPNTSSFFQTHGTHTAAFIPVLGAAQIPVGIYWIEGVKENEISYSDRELFSSFMSTLHERIKLMKSDKQLLASQSSLSQFIPKHLVPDFLAGKEVAEKDHGFLMMFDLKGSTRLAHSIGNSEFHTEVAKLKISFQMLLSQRNWILQQFVWDGFEFTYSSASEKNEKISVKEWHETMDAVFKLWKDTLLSKFGDTPEIRTLSYRICYTYGDTSRGIVVEGSTQKWTFTGNSIAVVSKLEQAAKSLPGEIFCDVSILPRSSDRWVELHTTTQGLVIYGLDVSESKTFAA